LEVVYFGNGYIDSGVHTTNYFIGDIPMRVYKDKYLSVTSILELKKPFNKEAFYKWCKIKGLDASLISNVSRTIGSKVSEHLDNIYHNLEWLTGPPTDSLEATYTQGVEDFAKEYKVESTEQEVYCDDLHYAGRFDGIISKDKKRYLADWKTYGAWKDGEYKRDSSKIKKARQQLSLYAHALGWEDGLAVVVFKNDGTWDFEEVDFDEDIVKWVRDNQKLIKEAINKFNKEK
jgi:hypothetical protein